MQVFNEPEQVALDRHDSVEYAQVSTIIFVLLFALTF